MPKLSDIMGKKAKPQEDFSHITIRPLGVINWVKTHPAFSYTIMCNDIGFSRFTFMRAMQAADDKKKKESDKMLLGPEITLKIEAYLADYGYDYKKELANLGYTHI